MSTSLATFIHISDLHFGHIVPNTRGFYNAVAPPYWANRPVLHGLLGHHARALVYLDQFFVKIRKEANDGDVQLIVTGDLTCVGSPEQFDMADRYLGGKLPNSEGAALGLSVRDWKKLAIPGNHDHWPGSIRMVGAPTQAFTDNFPSLPFWSDPLPLSTGQSLRFLGIDTDADVRHFGRGRVRARGSFSSQLVTAENKLYLVDKNEIRVLLLHHSLRYRDTSEPRENKKTLEIEPASRQALEEFIVENDIAVLLCGHVHVPSVESFLVAHTGRGKTVEVMEARCGTTLQRDTLPSNWITSTGGQAKQTLTVNTLLVHRLLKEDTELRWSTETYTRTPHGFEKEGPVGSLKVWPRS
jgi:3',5'-cyclic AMP phosphodiesterase CpdA